MILRRQILNFLEREQEMILEKAINRSEPQSYRKKITVCEHIYRITQINTGEGRPPATDVISRNSLVTHAHTHKLS